MRSRSRGQSSNCITWCEDLGEDNELLAGKVELLDRVSEYDFRKTVRVSLYFSKKLFISQVPMIRNVRWRCRRS